MESLNNRMDQEGTDYMSLKTRWKDLQTNKDEGKITRKQHQ